MLSSTHTKNRRNSSTMTTPEALNSQLSQTFPQEIEVQITLRVRVADQEARDYWLNPDTNAATIPFLADVFDTIGFYGTDDEIVSINNMTQPQLQQILNTEAAL